MSDSARDAASTDDDRLPWLEAVDDDGGEDGISIAKLAVLIISALVALGFVIGGVWWLRSRPAPGTVAKDPTLIAAQVGDYKVKPENPGGMKVEGKGDSAFAASEGTEPNGKIDTNATPETPLKGVKTAKAEVTAAKPSANPTVAVPKATAKLVAKPPVVVTTSATPGGRLVQLGAYGSEEKANAGWATLSKRYSFVGDLPKSIVAAQVGGSTVYRLRADAGTQAAQICGKLKAAGENCIQVN